MQTEDDRILGVFQDGSSDEDEGRKKNKKGGGGGGRKQQSSGKDHSKPMSFVGGKGQGGNGGGSKVGLLEVTRGGGKAARRHMRGAFTPLRLCAVHQAYAFLNCRL